MTRHRTLREFAAGPASGQSWRRPGPIPGTEGERAMSIASRITRRQFTAGAAAASVALAAPNIIRAQANELRVLTWEGYAEPEWVAPFEEATGATVSASYVGSVDEMFAKMQGSQGADFLQFRPLHRRRAHPAARHEQHSQCGQYHCRLRDRRAGDA
jgi:hypothetical protein